MLKNVMWRHSGLKVTALVPGWSSPSLSPGQVHCVVFLGKTLYSQSASLTVQPYNIRVAHKPATMLRHLLTNIKVPMT